MSLTKQPSTNRHMRLAPWLLLATLSFGLATGCSSRTHPRDLRSARITLERTPCYGVCPVYTVTLDGNGWVQYFGNFRVDIPGPQTGKVGPNTLRDLLNLANQIGFFQMRDSYSEACTDMPTSIISILVDGKSAKVSTKDSKGFTALEMAADQTIRRLLTASGRE